MKGTTIQLVEDIVVEYDPFGAPVTQQQLVDIDDVLVGQPTTQEVVDTMQVYGKRIEYVLGIPKGDSHKWEDATVYIWGKPYRTIGYPITGEQANIPLRWGMNVRVERYG